MQSGSNWTLEIPIPLNILLKAYFVVRRQILVTELIYSHVRPLTRKEEEEKDLPLEPLRQLRLSEF
jgi:hypothetical protein